MYLKRVSTATLLLALALPLVAQAIDAPEANRRCAAGESGPFEVQVPNGKVTCACNSGRCDAQTFTDDAGNTKGIGEALNFLQQAMGMIQSLLGNKGSGSGGKSGADAGTSGYGSPEGMNLPSLAPPAANFIPANGGVPTQSATNANIETAAKTNTAVDAVIKDPAENFLQAVSKGFNDITDRITEVTVGITEKIPPTPVVSGTEKKLGSERPDIRTTEGGKSIEIGITEDNTGVAGFYGSNNPQTEGLSLIGRLCVTRPWANSFISAIIAPTFFDSLCDRGGYQVGQLSENDKPVNGTEIRLKESVRAAESTTATIKKAKGISCTPAVLRQGAAATIEFSCGTGNTLTRASGFKAGINDSVATVHPKKHATYGIMCSDGFEQSCDIQVVNPRIKIWSEPQLVRLGTRATIRWDTADVEKDSCVVKGPSFSETGSYGGASTVPVSGPSTYTASCTALDGEQIIESVTVDLAL